MDFEKEFSGVATARAEGQAADLCFVPRQLLVDWFSGEDLKKIGAFRPVSIVSQTTLWDQAFDTIRCRHGLANPLAAWTNAAKVLPRWAVEYIFKSSYDAHAERRAQPAAHDEHVLAESMKEKRLVMPVHTSCCADCTRSLWDVYAGEAGLRSVTRCLSRETVVQGTSDELEAFLWQSGEGGAGHPSRSEDDRESFGIQWTWLPRALWVELFESGGLGSMGGQVGGIGIPSEEGLLMATMDRMCAFTVWTRHTGAGDEGDIDTVVYGRRRFWNGWLGLSDEEFIKELTAEIRTDMRSGILCKHSNLLDSDGNRILIYDAARNRNFHSWIDPASDVVLVPRNRLSCYIKTLYDKQAAIARFFGQASKMPSRDRFAILATDTVRGVVQPCKRCTEALRRKGRQTALFLAAKYPDRMPQCPLNRLPAEILSTIAREFL